MPTDGKMQTADQVMLPIPSLGANSLATFLCFKLAYLQLTTCRLNNIELSERAGDSAGQIPSICTLLNAINCLNLCY